MDSKIDIRSLRDCFGRFATGVTVVSYRSNEGARGVTMNSFTSVSLDPPLVLVSVARTSRSCAVIGSAPFAVNVLGAGQKDVALHFAGRPQDGIRIAWNDDEDVATTPSLADAIAVLQCKPWRQYDGGDHVLIVGEVTSTVTRDGEPLAFSAGQFVSMGLPLKDA